MPHILWFWRFYCQILFHDFFQIKIYNFQTAMLLQGSWLKCTFVNSQEILHSSDLWNAFRCYTYKIYLRIPKTETLYVHQLQCLKVTLRKLPFYVILHQRLRRLHFSWCVCERRIFSYQSNLFFYLIFWTCCKKLSCSKIPIF